MAAISSATMIACPSETRSPSLSCAPKSLCRYSGCAHAQEIHAHVQETENGTADSNRTDVYLAVEVADDPRVNETEKRDRHVGEDHRCGDTPDITIAWQSICVVTYRLLRKECPGACR